MASAGLNGPGPPQPHAHVPRRALVLVAVISGLGVCVCAALIYGQVTQASPEASARHFLDALVARDYQSAYATLSSRAQREWARRGDGPAELNFAQFAAGLDRAYGEIEHYTLGPGVVHGVRATIIVTTVRPNALTEADVLDLVRAGSGWAIDEFVPGPPAARRANRAHGVDSAARVVT